MSKSSGGTYSWTGSGFTTKSPTWSSGGTWTGSSWWKSSGGTGGKKEKKYKSSLGYSSSSYYDYTSSSYYGTWGTSYTNTEDEEAVEKLLTSAYKSVREAVVILDFPFKVDICFAASTFLSNSKKENRKIFLSSKILDSKKKTDAEKIDVLCGGGIHEAAHLKYTELKVIKSFGDLLVSSGIDKDKELKFIMMLANIIEDERVEDKLLRERPGYEDFLVKKKEFDYENSTSLVSTSDKLTKLFADIVKFIRFRNKFQADSIDPDYAYIFDEIDKEIQQVYGNDLVNTKFSCQAAENLSKFIKKSLQEKHGFDESTVVPEMKAFGKRADFYTQVLSGLDTEEKYSDELSALLSDLQTHLVGSRSLETKEKLATGSFERDGKTLIIKDVEGNLDNYNKIKKEISPLVPALRRILVAQDKNYDFVIHGCRSGLLDTNKLAEAYQGVPQVYTRMGHVRTNNTAVCILIDESGSMNWGFHGSSRCKIARKAGILFNEAFGSVPGVDLFIYGHSADRIEDYTTELLVYREPGMGIDQYKALSDVSARCENRDGDAILSAAKRVRKFTQSSCTMFVISDGAPCAIDYHGYDAVSDTRKKIVKAQTTLNMNIVGICIDADVPGDELYDTHVDLLDLSTLPKTLGQMIKKTIMENRSTVTS